jgi:rod shape-determining protein MreD
MSSATSSRHIWTYRAIFLFSCAVILGRLLPLGLGESGLPGPRPPSRPDLRVASAAAGGGAAGIIVIVFLMADFLLQRPPGLWTALVVLASESLRRRRLQMTEFPFLVEWGAIAGAVAGMVLAERVILWVLFADPAVAGPQPHTSDRDRRDLSPCRRGLEIRVRLA